MEIRYLIKPRQGGKTWDLLHKSAHTKYPIIVRNTDECKHLKKKAESMGLEIPNPISINTIIKGIREGVQSIPGMIGCHVMVDDADCILQELIRRGINCDIDTIAMVQRNDKGHEVTIYGEDLNEKYHLDDGPANIVDPNNGVKPLTESQIKLLWDNNIPDPSVYCYLGILTRNNIAYDKSITVQKFLQFRNKSDASDVIEIEVNIDDIINGYYS